LTISGAVGTLMGLVKVFGAIGAESVDPSQRARILAEGISEAMNCTAFSLAVWVPSAIAVLVITRKGKGAARR
jgi:biopolymer transport protein ExbB